MHDEPSFFEKLFCVAVVALIGLLSFGATNLFPFLQGSCKKFFFIGAFIAIATVAIREFAGRLQEQESLFLSVIGFFGTASAIVSLAIAALIY